MWRVIGAAKWTQRGRGTDPRTDVSRESQPNGRRAVGARGPQVRSLHGCNLRSPAKLPTATLQPSMLTQMVIQKLVDTRPLAQSRRGLGLVAVADFQGGQLVRVEVVDLWVQGVQSG